MNRISPGIIVMFAIALLFTACNKEKLEQLQSQNQSLTTEKAYQDSVLNDLLGTLNQFEDNISEIKHRENLVSASTMGSSELGEGGKEQILQDIQLINQLMADNRQIIADLTSQLESAEGQSTQLRRAVNRLKRQLEEQDAEVSTLKDELATLNMTVEDLNGQIDTLTQINSSLASLRAVQTSRIASQEERLESQTATIAAQTEELHTVYYVSAPLRDLKRRGVMDGRKLASDLDASQLTKIDMLEITSIPLGAKKAKLRTPHPSDSYIFTEGDGDISSIDITDPQRFWSASRYLVIELD